MDGSGYTATYNLRGQLATITKAGVTTRYTYNAAGQRVRKVSSTGPQSTVVFVYDQAGHLLGEYDQNGAALREYVWLRDTPMAMFTPDPANPSGEPLVYFIHSDHLNTPRVVVDRENRVRWRWLAEPFGTSAPETNPSGLGVFVQNLRFPGQYADQESGLFYNYHRYYAAGGGQYTQSDPIGLASGSASTYGYVDGNPLSYIDPDGLMEIYRDGKVTMHSYPGPQAGGNEHARQGPGAAYHIHVKDGQGREARISTETWKPLTPDDKKIYESSKEMQKACDKLTEGEKKWFDRLNRQIFHRGGPTVNQLLRMGTIRGGNRGPVVGGRTDE